MVKEHMANVTRIKASDPGKAADQPTKAEKQVDKALKRATKAAQKQTQKTAKTKKPARLPVRIITAPFRYIRDSWREVRQVRWPSRGATWKMVLAVLAYTLVFGVLIMLLDALFTLIFNQILN